MTPEEFGAATAREIAKLAPIVKASGNDSSEAAAAAALTLRFPSASRTQEYAWPGGKRLAFTVTTNIEWFAFGAGLGNDPAKAGEPQTQRNYSGATTARIGIWRLFDLLDELGLPAGHCTNSLIYEYAPQITDAIRRRGDEVIAHGRSNAENLRGLWQPDEERILREVTETIARHEGRAPTGWFGAGAYETASHAPSSSRSSATPT